MTVSLRSALLALLVAAGCGSSTSPSDVGGASPSPPPPPLSPDPTARYQVTFNATWSRDTHPNRFPTNPHFSPLVGATHQGEVRFWEPGAIASDGIEAMAERGKVSPLDDIIRAAINEGTAHSLLVGEGIERSPGEVSLELELTREHPFVTLVSMIAPSPDWFVGISARDFLESGDWPGQIVIELFPYDAGTDSGEFYGSTDRDTVPPEPVSRITGAPLTRDGIVAPLGTFTFTRIGN